MFKMGESPGKYVPFVVTKEAAVEKAIGEHTCTMTNLMTATESTTWFVLQLTFSEDKVLEHFHSGALRSHPARNSLRFHGDLQLSEAAAVEWLQCATPPIGMPRWASRLNKIFLNVHGSCNRCGAQDVFVGSASHSEDTEKFYAECWHSELVANAPAGVYMSADDGDASGKPRDIVRD